MICVHVKTAPQALHSVHGLVDAQSRHELIARAAYDLAEHRGFEPGHELDDWLCAEQQVEAALSCGAPQALG
jgi:Protein of unknown function (DUF2934)